MNIIEIRVQAINDTARGLEAAKGSAEEAGGEAGDGFAAAFANGLAGRLAEAAAGAGAQAAAALAESVAGTGDVIGSEIGSSLASGLGDAPAAAGAEAGTALAQGMAEGASGVGDTIGQELGSGLAGQAEAAGQRAGEALSEGVDAGSAAAGTHAVDHLEADLATLQDSASSAGAAAGHALTAALSGSIGSLFGIGTAGAAALTAGLSTAALAASAVDHAIAQAISSGLTDQLGEAGDSAGAALITAVRDAASGGAADVSLQVRESLESGLEDALGEAGQAAGGSLMAGVQSAASGDAGQVAEKISEAVQSPLDVAMDAVGASAADTLLASISAALAAGNDVLAEQLKAQLANTVGYAFGNAPTQVIEGEIIASQMLEAGAQAGQAFQEGADQSLEQAAVEVAGHAAEAGALVAQELGTALDTGIEHAGEQAAATATAAFVRVGEQMVRVSLDARGMIAGAWAGALDFDQITNLNKEILAERQLSQTASSMVPQPENFAAMSDQQVATWMRGIEARLEESEPELHAAFASAVEKGLGGLDWESLTEAQQTAYNAAVSQEFAGVSEEILAQAAEVSAAAEQVGAAAATGLEAGLASSGPAVAGELVSQLGELGPVAAEEGAAAGGMFARAFSGATGAVAESFRADFAEDPAWQGAMDKARVLGADVQQAFSAVGQSIREEFAQDPAWQARMAEVRSLSDSIVGGIKGGYGAISDLGSAAVGHARDAFGAIGDFGARSMEGFKVVVSGFGDIGPALAEKVTGAFEALSTYAAEDGNSIGGKFARALTSSISAFAGSASALGESARILFARTSEEAGLAGAEAGDAFTRMLADGLMRGSPHAVAVIELMQQQVGAALAAGDDELAQSLISRVDAIQLTANQALDLGPAVQRGVGALNGAGDEIIAVFESIYQQSALLSDSVATAMTNALAGIEADTSGFTTEELAKWNEFYAALEERGTQAAYQMAASMGSLQGKDLMSLGLGSTGNPMGKAGSEAEGLASELGGVEKAAGKATSGMGGMASMMYGPWGMAIYGAMAVLPMLGGALGALAKAFDPAQAVLLNTQNLATAIANDGNVAGAATAAFVAQSSATDGLAASAKSAGVSLTTWTEAVMGNKTAQEQVTAAVDALNQRQLNAAVATDEAAKSTGKFSDESKQAKASVTEQADASNKLTDANQKLMNSMQAEYQQIVAGIQGQTQLAQATAALDMNSQILGATLTGLYTKMQLSAQQSAISSVANLNLGTSQMTLNTQLVNAEQAYTEVQAGASAYNTVLTALNGTALTADQAQNTLAQAMLTAKTSFAQNKDSLDLNTQAGINNRTALVSASQAITAMGVAQYQATGDINKANQTIQTQIDNYVKATGATGQAKLAIEGYLESITKIPPNVSTTVNLNTGPAFAALSSLLGTINSSSGTVNVYENSGGQVFTSGGGNRAQAVGGPSTHYAAVGGAQYGSTIMNEQGAEAVNLPNGSMVVPAANTAALMSGAFAPTGQQNTLVLEVVGGEPELVALLRKIVRVRGGGGVNSVQRAFGQVAAR